MTFWKKGQHGRAEPGNGLECSGMLSFRHSMSVVVSDLEQQHESYIKSGLVMACHAGSGYSHAGQRRTWRRTPPIGSEWLMSEEKTFSHTDPHTSKMSTL